MVLLNRRITALVQSSEPISRDRYSFVRVIRLAYNLVCADVSVNLNLHKYRYSRLIFDIHIGDHTRYLSNMSITTVDI
jgi:hypothetical protein